MTWSQTLPEVSQRWGVLRRRCANAGLWMGERRYASARVTRCTNLLHYAQLWQDLCAQRVWSAEVLWGASSARSRVGEYIYSVRVRVVNKPGFCHGSSVELVIRRDEGQPGEALGRPGGVHREDGRELYGIIPT